MSTPASLIPPNTSITFPSAFFPFSGYFKICTNTFFLSLAFPQLAFDINISVPKFLSSGTTNAKFLLFWKVPTTVSFSCLTIFTILPSCFLSPSFSAIILIATVSPFKAFFEFSLDIYISSSWSSIFTNPNPFWFFLYVPIISSLLIFPPKLWFNI